MVSEQLYHPQSDVSHHFANNKKSLATQGFWALDNLERVMGIEPTLLAWKAKVLPLNYTRKKHWSG
ncbi:MAG: hypothetical protein K0Q63_3599 [Paenibacillus sp.]|nr:hypothetical protein [Paenibacillus sp.]